MIDPIHSLAFSMQANRGVYALLLGSGVSRAGKIPTGWEITLDLVRKLAAISGESCDPIRPDEWYQAKFGQDPDYSALLDAIAKTPAERQQLLRGYWEPSEQEREEGEKQPTAAHRAIALLVAQGFVKVIITTNFDRLMETALAEVSVTPTILSTPDQVIGALPLIHTRCCLIKVHGDYLDTRIRNTPQELGSYPAEFDTLLDRILDEFGLVVCGWSSDWDEALRKALLRAPSRRFATYWAIRGDPSKFAQLLIDHRAAQTISIKDADSFFGAVQQLVQSLEEFSRPHPLSTEAAVASLKRYLTENRYRIQLTDLINDEIDRVRDATSGPGFALQGGHPPDSASATARVRAYEAACSTLLAMAPVGAFWAEKEHYHVWQRGLESLSSVGSDNGFPLWLELQRYRGTLLLYALGLGAVEAHRLQFLGGLFATPVWRENRQETTAVEVLLPSCLFSQGGKVAQFLEGMNKRHAPMNDWLHQTLRKSAQTLIPNDTRYTFVFDKLEVMMALGYAHQTNQTKDSYWAPLGAFGYRTDNRQRVLAEIQQSISAQGDQSPYVRSGIFGDSAEACALALTAFGGFTEKIGRSW